MSIPLLSIIMTNYNHAKYLDDAVGSILIQFSKSYELIIVDDCSTDNSFFILQQLIQGHPNASLTRNNINRGVTYSSNLALSQARGEYIYYACADDKVLPGLFGKSLDMLFKYPQAGLCCSDPVILDEECNVAYKKSMRISDRPRYFSKEEVFSLMRKKPIDIISPPTTIIKRALWIEAGALRPELQYHSDWLPVFTIAARNGFCYIPEALTLKRMFVSGSYSCKRSRFEETLSVLKKVISILDSPDFQDMRLIFKKSGVLSRFRLNLLYVFLSNPKYWHYITFLYLIRLLRYQVMAVLSYFGPVLRRAYYRFFKTESMLSREGAIYGKA